MWNIRKNFCRFLILFLKFFFISDILNYFDDIIKNEPDTTPALAAVKTLIEIVKIVEGMELYISISYNSSHPHTSEGSKESQMHCKWTMNIWND